MLPVSQVWRWLGCVVLFAATLHTPVPLLRHSFNLFLLLWGYATGAYALCHSLPAPGPGDVNLYGLYDTNYMNHNNYTS